MDTAQVTDLFDRLGRMEGKQDLLIDNQEKHYVALQDHSVRIRGLEKNQARMFAWVSGICAAFSVMGSDIKNYFGDMIHG